MNQEQRKFLIDRVNKTFNTQKEELEHRIKERPSLNNYLVAAFLDNSIQFNNIDDLKVKIRETVLRFGTGDKLVDEEGARWRNGRAVEDVKNTCRITAEDLFIIPEAYKVALSEYETNRDKIKEEVARLEAQKDTIIMKIQIGSNSVLDKLVTQVDNLVDLDIMNSQFLLT